MVVVVVVVGVKHDGGHIRATASVLLRFCPNFLPRGKGRAVPVGVCPAWCTRFYTGACVSSAVQSVCIGVAVVYVTAKSGLRFVLIEFFVLYFFD
jgi:hypothetical protein